MSPRARPSWRLQARATWSDARVTGAFVRTKVAEWTSMLRGFAQAHAT